jgi:hypothetical protein
MADSIVSVEPDTLDKLIAAALAEGSPIVDRSSLLAAPAHIGA